MSLCPFRLKCVNVQGPEFTIFAIQLCIEFTTVNFLETYACQNLSECYEVIGKPVLSSLAKMIIDVFHFRLAPRWMPAFFHNLKIAFTAQARVFCYWPLGVRDTYAE